MKQRIKIGGYTYHRVQMDWHRLDTPDGTFFGRTRDEVFRKAMAADDLKAAAKFRFPQEDTPERRHNDG